MVLLETNEKLIKKWRFNKKKLIKNEIYDIRYNNIINTDDNLTKTYKELQSKENIEETKTKDTFYKDKKIK